MGLKGLREREREIYKKNTTGELTKRSESRTDNKETTKRVREAQQNMFHNKTIFIVENKSNEQTKIFLIAAMIKILTINL